MLEAEWGRRMADALPKQGGHLAVPSVGRPPLEKQRLLRVPIMGGVMQRCYSSRALS